MTDVLVDTCVWSLALRRGSPTPNPAADELARLVRDGRAVILGPVRQELLSGVGSAEQFETLRAHLRAFPDLELGVDDYERAAAFCNRCRANGVQGGGVDFLICAAAAGRRVAVFTTDRDFDHYARVLGVTLHVPQAV